MEIDEEVLSKLNPQERAVVARVHQLQSELRVQREQAEQTEPRPLYTNYVSPEEYKRRAALQYRGQTVDLPL